MAFLAVDARGCFVRRENDPLDQVSPDGLRRRLAGPAWRRLVFHRVAAEHEGLPIFVADTAAIGDLAWPYDPLVLPSGWHAPTRVSLEWARLRHAETRVVA